MSADSPAVILFSTDGYELSVKQNNNIPSGTPAILLAGSDGYAARVLGIDNIGSAYIAGKAPIGSLLSSNPVAISGTDNNALKRSLRTDNMGRLQITAAIVPDLASTIINLAFRASDGAIVSGSFKRVITYTIPAGYSGYLIRFTTYQAEVAYSRIIIERILGTHIVTTNVFTAGASYIDPQFAAIVEAEVTTQFGAANNITLTVTYTNHNGVAGRTGTFSIPKSSIVGARFALLLQAGDIGVRSIQNISASPSGGAGAIRVYGFIQLALHFDLSLTAGVYTDYAPAAVVFPAGTVLGLEYAGGTVAKDRWLGGLIQLVAQ